MQHIDPAGFFVHDHLPPLPEQAAQHAQSRPMALAEQVAALRRVAELLVAGTPELHRVGGRID